jgi:hypothetical protein
MVIGLVVGMTAWVGALVGGGGSVGAMVGAGAVKGAAVGLGAQLVKMRLAATRLAKAKDGKVFFLISRSQEFVYQNN